MVKPRACSATYSQHYFLVRPQTLAEGQSLNLLGSQIQRSDSSMLRIGLELRIGIPVAPTEFQHQLAEKHVRTCFRFPKKNQGLFIILVYIRFSCHLRHLILPLRSAGRAVRASPELPRDHGDPHPRQLPVELRQGVLQQNENSHLRPLKWRLF